MPHRERVNWLASLRDRRWIFADLIGLLLGSALAMAAIIGIVRLASPAAGGLVAAVAWISPACLAVTVWHWWSNDDGRTATGTACAGIAIAAFPFQVYYGGWFNAGVSASVAALFALLLLAGLHRSGGYPKTFLAITLAAALPTASSMLADPLSRDEPASFLHRALLEPKIRRQLADGHYVEAIRLAEETRTAETMVSTFSSVATSLRERVHSAAEHEKFEEAAGIAAGAWPWFANLDGMARGTQNGQIDWIWSGSQSIAKQFARSPEGRWTLDVLKFSLLQSSDPTNRKRAIGGGS